MWFSELYLNIINLLSLCRIVKSVGIKNIIINIFHQREKLSDKHKLIVSTQNYKADLNRTKWRERQMQGIKVFSISWYCALIFQIAKYLSIDLKSNLLHSIEMRRHCCQYVQYYMDFNHNKLPVCHHFVSDCRVQDKTQLCLRI